MSGTRVAFEKWEGLGNDFVLVEVPAEAWSDEQVRAVCDRRRGVGADGVLFVSRGAPPGDAPRGKDWRTPPRGELPRMVVRNADGSRPEMCGNGIRCVAGWLAPRGALSGEIAREGLDPAASSDAAVVTIATDAGPKRCEVTGGDGRFEVSVAMGPARIEGTLAVEVDGRAHAFTRGDVGNPHAITFEPYDQAEIDRVGPRVATSPRDGTNVEFCRLVRGGAGGVASRKRSGDAARERLAEAAPDGLADVPRERLADVPRERLEDVPRVDVVVWERGVGRTLACGTGACAVASAACAAGYFPYGAPVRVRLPGGDLFIAVEAGTWAATMRGPARRVFTGELVTP